MSDPQPERLKPRPPRANPVQPDRPAGADEQAESPTQGEPAGAAERRKEQANAALENVREGYGN